MFCIDAESAGANRQYHGYFALIMSQIMIDSIEISDVSIADLFIYIV